MKQFIFFIALLAGTCAVAQVQPATLPAAESDLGFSFYSQGDFANAADYYRQLTVHQDRMTRNHLAEAWYNLGNACFKQGELAQAILSYERCLRLNPRHKDANYNLAFARTRIVDNIEDNRSFFLSGWLESLRNQLREQTWMLLAVVFFLLTLAGVLIFALSRESALRKTAFYIALIALVLSVSSLANAGSLHRRDNRRAEAIITQGIVNAKASPDRSGTELFTLHEGTKVTIHETIGDWCNIHVGNNIGWIPLAYLERI